MKALLGLALLVALAGCGALSSKSSSRIAEGSCMRLQAERDVRGEALCEDAWLCTRPPGGPFTSVGLRRLARCEGDTGPVVLYLPGMHMNAELPLLSANNDIRLYLAQAGVRVWGIDYRTHTVAPDASSSDLRVMNGWSSATFADDVAWAAGFVRGGDPGPFFLMGFSYGAGLAYRVASRGDVPVAGLVILDGVAGDGGSSSGGPIDVGSSRLPFDVRKQLLAQVKTSPNGPSPLPGYPSASAALADVLYTAKSFGGEGGLSNTRDGASDVGVLARLLASYDRWWPGGATSPGAPERPSRTVPVIAFANEQMGDRWIERVRASARAYGGEQAVVRTVPASGHLDVLVGKQSSRVVYEPTRAWLAAKSGLDSR